MYGLRHGLAAGTGAGGTPRRASSRIDRRRCHSDTDSADRRRPTGRRRRPASESAQSHTVTSPRQSAHCDCVTSRRSDHQPYDGDSMVTSRRSSHCVRDVTDIRPAGSATLTTGPWSMPLGGFAENVLQTSDYRSTRADALFPTPLKLCPQLRTKGHANGTSATPRQRRDADNKGGTGSKLTQLSSTAETTRNVLSLHSSQFHRDR